MWIDDIIKERLYGRVQCDCDCDYYEGRANFPEGEKPVPPPNIIVKDGSTKIRCASCGKIRSKK
jgi:hypothetical protein